MSAFLVSDEHIHALLTWANARRVRLYVNGRSYDASHTDALATLGGILKNTNVEAINTRYRENEISEPYKFCFRLRFAHMKPVEILKACSCYDYQACEIDHYETTDAQAIINAIRHCAIRGLPGYDNAAWEITAPEEQ